jgi:prepilin signal peptidase PulO-like enzyme (type II secretory pathway)
MTFTGAAPDPKGTSRRTRRLTCPHCHQEFDYDVLPGASVTAVRLGRSRYMRCPMCHRFAVFELSHRPAGASGPAPPRFDDRRTTLVWSGRLLVPALAIILAGAFLPLSLTFRLTLMVSGTVVFAAAVVLLLVLARSRRIR